VVLDAEDRSRCRALQSALNEVPGTIGHCALDLLQLNGEKLTRLPLLKCKEDLRATVYNAIRTGTIQIPRLQQGRWIFEITIHAEDWSPPECSS
jgi:hypothetical protein